MSIPVIMKATVILLITAKVTFFIHEGKFYSII